MLIDVKEVFFSFVSSPCENYICATCPHVKCGSFCYVECLRKEDQIGQPWEKQANQPNIVCDESLQRRGEK